MKKLVEETIQKIDANKEIFDTLPRNNAKNISAYMKKLDEAKKEFTGYEKAMLEEMEKRFNDANDITVNPELASLEQEMENAKSVLYLLNDTNTSFEKMNFDKTTYDLRYYYKKNLEVISDAIFYCIKKFKELGINLRIKDFCYNKYVREYLAIFFEELDKVNIDRTKIKTKFEEIYWECSNIIIYIELNIRSLYFENEKAIEKYYNDKQKQLLNSNTQTTYLNKYMKIRKQLIEKTIEDKAIVIHDFLEGQINTKDFTHLAIGDRYTRFIPKEIMENVDENKMKEIDANLEQLQNSLLEYKNYLTYKFIIDDVKKIYTEKEKYKNIFTQIKKNIANEEKKIMKLDSKISIKSKKSNDKLISEQDSLILKVRDMYRDLEKNKVYYKIATELEDNSTVSDALYLASSFYNYIADCMREVDKEVEEEEIDTTIKALREFVLWPYSTILNNISILENKDILSMIKDRYKLLGINITADDLDEGNLDMLIATVNNIEIGNNIKKNKIDVEEIKNICEFKKILAK